MLWQWSGQGCCSPLFFWRRCHQLGVISLSSVVLREQSADEKYIVACCERVIQLLAAETLHKTNASLDLVSVPVSLLPIVADAAVALPLSPHYLSSHVPNVSCPAAVYSVHTTSACPSEFITITPPTFGRDNLPSHRSNSPSNPSNSCIPRCSLFLLSFVVCFGPGCFLLSAPP